MIQVDLLSTPQRVVSIVPASEHSAHSGDAAFVLLNDAQSNALLLRSASLPLRYIKFVGGEILEMTALEKTASDAIESSREEAVVKDEAKATLDTFRSQSLALRATVEVLVDELNAIRAQVLMPPVDFARLQAAIEAKIDAAVKSTSR